VARGGGSRGDAGCAGGSPSLGEAPAALAAAGWPVALALCAAFLLSNWGLQYGAARLAAHTTALIMLTELLFASVSSAWLDAAEFSTRTLVGGALIVFAALLAALGPDSDKPADK
jgi:drug/metabolite transporter (DMT)-like permease